MPARQSGTFHCYCLIYSTSCKTGPDGTPLGKFILESQCIFHLACTKAEIQRQSDIQNTAASLFVSTLVDDGPNPHSQLSRLWSSHKGHQSSASRISLEPEILIDTIIESFQHLWILTPKDLLQGHQALPIIFMTRQSPICCTTSCRFFQSHETRGID